MAYGKAVKLDTLKISLEKLIYKSFANVLDARRRAQQNHCLDVDELKAVEDKLWRLFIGQACGNSKDGSCERTT